MVDYHLPSVDGLKVAARLKSLQPDCRVILTSSEFPAASELTPIWGAGGPLSRQALFQGCSFRGGGPVVSPRSPVIEPLFAPADPALLLPAVRRFVLMKICSNRVTGSWWRFPGGRLRGPLAPAPENWTRSGVLRPGGGPLRPWFKGRGLPGGGPLCGRTWPGDLELPFHGGDGDVRGLAQSEKISLQMAARQLRLGFLEKVRREHAYDRVALGHTADDQVELFFLRLLRGAGSEGLKGMWPATPQGLGAAAFGRGESCAAGLAPSRTTAVPGGPEQPEPALSAQPGAPGPSAPPAA